MSRPPHELDPYRSARDFYGAELRRCRQKAGMTLEELAEKLLSSRSHLQRVEIGEALPPDHYSAMLDELFETDGLFTRLYELVRQTQEIHPQQFRRRMQFEARAQLIQEYTPQIAPGLLQTEGYARAQFELFNPRATSEEIENLVTARLSRQDLLKADAPPELSFIIDEALVRRSYGTPDIMREQLARLADAALTPTTMVQLIPFRHGGHALAGGTLTLMTLHDGTQVAYEEAGSTGTLLESSDSVTARQRAYDRLRACALPPSETAAFLRSVMEELPT
ncbi:helix-turn-helix transcriptional regulator [Streptomyces capparidis]